MSHARAATPSCVVLAALGTVLAAGTAWAGLPRPELALQAGRTFGVASSTDGQYDQGGLMFQGALLWSFESRFRFGLTGFAADIGSETQSIVAPGTDEQPPIDYGLSIQGHRSTFGAAWRVDALGTTFGKVGRGFATGSYGYFRFRNDELGEVKGAVSALGGSLGLGLEHAFNASQTLGLVAAATWMSDEHTPYYGSAALEWKWR